MEDSAGKGEPGGPEQKIREMLAAVETAVFDEDYEFVNKVGGEQTLITAIEFGEYMDAKRSRSEDPVEVRRWADAIKSFLPTLDGKEFDKEEIERLNAIVERMKFDDIVDNEEVADEPEESSMSEQKHDDNIDEDEFYVEFSKEELDTIMNNPVFVRAKDYATGTGSRSSYHPNLQGAIDTIDDVQGGLKHKMRKVLDWYVYTSAKDYATGKGNRSSYHPNLQEAIDIVEGYASDSAKPSEITPRIRSALDKHVLKLANEYATGTGTRSMYHPNTAEAKNIIESYASSPERADAMLRKLGFK